MLLDLCYSLIRGTDKHMGTALQFIVRKGSLNRIGICVMGHFRGFNWVISIIILVLLCAGVQRGHAYIFENL